MKAGEVMENKVSLNIPLGYRIVKKTDTVDIWEAERILTSKKRNKYIQAIRKDTSADLIGIYLICPKCNSFFAANSNNRMFQNYRKVRNNRNNKEMVRRWLDRQISFFEENKDNNLYVSSPIQNPESFKCPKCNAKSQYSEKTRCVDIIRRKNKIIVECEIVDIKEIFSLKWMPLNSISLTFGLHEIIVFNFGKGRVIMKLKNDKGDILCERDITDNPEIVYGGAIHSVIVDNKIVNRTVKRFFAQIWKSEIPYTGSSINIVDLFKMTRFVGYNKEFYDYIPYTLGSFAIDNSFKSISRRMHNANNIINVYESSSLPNVKSVRKICFEKAGMLFYLNEIEKMYEIINDLNLFCSLLKSEYIFAVLSELHIRPLLTEYFKDFINTKGTKSLLRCINRFWHSLCYEAIDYMSMSEKAKKIIRQNWKKSNCFGERRQNDTFHSIPMRHPTDKIKDCSVNGYKFFWLRNSNDYIFAGEKLNNCLGSWGPGNWPVVCVKKQEKYIAAIEVSDKGIEQALEFNNIEFEEDSQLFKAFEKWRNEHNLEWNHDFDNNYYE